MPKSSSLSTCKVLLLSISIRLDMYCIMGGFPAINYSIFLSSGEAESGLERLHQCAEKELQVFLNGDGPSKDFNDFRTKLAGLTR